MGAGSSAGNGGNRSDRTNPNKPPVSYSPPKKTNPIVDYIRGGGLVGTIARQIKKSAADVKTKRQANVEVGLGTDRMSNYTVDQGGTRERGGEADRVQGMEAPQTIIKKTAGGQTVQVIAPTQAEVSQSAAADADADNIYTRKKKSKARGRSMMTLTSSQGVKDNKLTLGKPSLLGS